MALSKEQLRKFHGIAEPTSPIVPAVFARRKAHEAAAQWLARWLTDLQIVFALIGLIVVLLPTLSKPWRAIIDGIPIVARVFHDYSTLSGWAMAHVFILVSLLLVRNALSKHMQGGYTVGLTFRDVMDMELYPRTRKEEFAYWTHVVFTAAAAPNLLLLPFGCFAFFIRIGS